jgi:nitroreductase
MRFVNTGSISPNRLICVIASLLILVEPVKGFCTASKHSQRAAYSAYASRLCSTLPYDCGCIARSSKAAFDNAVISRYACKRFKRFDGKENNASASISNPFVVQQALHCLELARQAPSAFNTQPYRLVLVHSQKQKEELSKYCLGPNQQRILDSDCTAVFLADRQIIRTFPRYRELFASKDRKNRLTSLFYITLFSSGYPLPRWLAAILSFGVRTALSFINLFTRRFYPMPSLANAETWSSKQASMVAMTFMLACTCRGIGTIPMEGINSSGIRQALGVPSRYAVPLIVAAGTPYKEPRTLEAERRYPMTEMIYENVFGNELKLPVASQT